MERFRRRAVCASLALIASQWCTVSLGAERNVLTLREAIERASTRNPAIAAFVFDSEATRQQSLAQALPPPTSVEAHFENFAGTGDASGTKVLEATLQLSHVVELGGKAAARRDVGTVGLERLHASQRAKRADALAEVARRFVHVLSDQEHLQATTRAMLLAERSRDAVQERIRAGATSQIFLGRAEIVLARARIEQEHAEHELASSRVALATLWGDSEPTFPAVSGDLYALPALEPLETYWQRLEGNPELLAFAAEERLFAARARLAQSQRKPNITFNAGIRRLEEFDDQALVAGFSIPLGSRKRSEPELAAVHAEHESLTLNRESRRLELRSTLFALYQEALHARTEANALRTDIRPQAERVVQTSNEGYRAGRFSLIELADAQSQLVDIERDAIRAAADFHSHLIEIERITGEPMHALAR
jgi:cobalt-zinc-cadmium efflux system outer membrane protein